MNEFKVLQLKTEAMAHVVIRNAAGRKLFDMTMPGLTLVVTVSSNAEIKVDPGTP